MVNLTPWGELMPTFDQVCEKMYQQGRKNSGNLQYLIRFVMIVKLDILSWFTEQSTEFKKS